MLHDNYVTLHQKFNPLNMQVYMRSHLLSHKKVTDPVEAMDPVMTYAQKQSVMEGRTATKKKIDVRPGALDSFIQERAVKEVWYREYDNGNAKGVSWGNDTHTPSKSDIVSAYDTYFAYETQGRREEQEDQFFGLETNENRKVDEAKAFLLTAFKQTADLIEEAYIKDGKVSSAYNTGSTANVVYIPIEGKAIPNSYSKYIIVANAGDSRAVLIDIGPDNKVTVTRLSCDHSPTDQNERKRISAVAEAKIQDGRLCYQNAEGYYLQSVNVSRGFGDRRTPGVICEPEISICHVESKPNHQYFVANFCDGVTEKLSDKDIGRVVEKTSEGRGTGWERNIAGNIVRAAFNAESSDNITCNVIELFPAVNQIKDIVMGVFDGHGGAEIAKFVKHAMETYVTQGLDQKPKKSLQDFQLEEITHRYQLDEKAKQQHKEQIVKDYKEGSRTYVLYRGGKQTRGITALYT